jgi:hypothetical protein
MKIKTYEIEISSKTSRTYYIDAESADEAIERAFYELDHDWEISTAWKDGAEIESCEPYFLDENGRKVVGTSHMDDDQFGAYIGGEEADAMDYDGMGNHKR